MRFLGSLAAGALALAGCQSAGDGSDPAVAELDAGAASSASPDAGAPAGPSCPPAGPFGDGVGEVAADMVLLDCDGSARSLHELCARRAVWLFEYADWCPPCRAFASAEANRIYERFTGADFEAYVIVSEDAGFGEPDASDCAEIRERYGLRMPVLFDPDTAFEDTFDVASNEVQVVLQAGAVIDWKGHYAADEVEGRIESVLSR